VVEDSREEWAAIGNAFKYFGLKKVTLAESGARARRLLEELLAQGGGCPFDLVISDLHMPGMTSLELTRFIRDHPALRGLPIVVLSENATVETVQELSKLHISAFLLKPVSPAEIAEKVSEVLQHQAVPKRDQLAG